MFEFVHGEMAGGWFGLLEVLCAESPGWFLIQKDVISNGGPPGSPSELDGGQLHESTYRR
jgi:hypothetical protein